MQVESTQGWGVVTGASSGIGAEFARQLAGQGMPLLLVARRQERLQELAAELQQAHGVEIATFPLDLCLPEAPGRLLQRIEELPAPLSLLVNNAGIGNVARLQQTDPARIRQLIELNIRALTELTYGCLPGMQARNAGGIIQVASIAAFQPLAYMSAYAASKAFVLHFSEGLWAELQGTNVRMLALCPGTTRTEFFQEAGVADWLSRRGGQTPDRVVQAALRSLERNRPVCIPGWSNWFTCQLQRIFPRSLVASHSKSLFEGHLDS